LLGFSKLSKDCNKIIRFKKKIKAELQTVETAGNLPANDLEDGKQRLLTRLNQTSTMERSPLLSPEVEFGSSVPTSVLSIASTPVQKHKYMKSASTPLHVFQRSLNSMSTNQKYDLYLKL
jgi:hypothetical protein